jgi:hypothetical protein
MAPPRRAEASPATSGLSQSLQSPVGAAASGVASAAPAAAEPAPTGAAPRQPLCRACRLNRTIPDQTVEENRRWWAEIERAKRRLVSSLIALRLPVASRVSEDPTRGLAFDLLRAPPGGPPVTTGHADGIITLDIEEADDSRREGRKAALREALPHAARPSSSRGRALLLERLSTGRLARARPRAVRRRARATMPPRCSGTTSKGPPTEWPLSHVSAYASAHPWEGLGRDAGRTTCTCSTRWTRRPASDSTSAQVEHRLRAFTPPVLTSGPGRGGRTPRAVRAGADAPDVPTRTSSSSSTRG